MRSLVVEPNASGHRLHLAGLIAEGLVEAGHEVCIATSSAASSSLAWDEFIGGLADDVQVDESAPSSLTTAPSRVAWGWLMRTAAEGRFDHVHIPDGDRITQFATWWPPARRSVRSSGAMFHVLLLRNRYAYDASGPRDRIVALASRIAARRNPWQVTLFLDPFAVERSRWINPQQRSRVLVPEPVEPAASISKTDARRYFALDPDLPTLVMPGSIDARKGADLLVEAFSTLGRRDGQLLLAGRIAPDVGDIVREACSSTNAPPVFALDRFATEWEFWASMRAADVIAVPYPLHIGSSGILARAAYLSTPTVASDYGWIGEATRRYGLGTTVNVRDPGALGEAISTSLGGSHVVDPERAREYVGFNTPESFKRVWTAAGR